MWNIPIHTQAPAFTVYFLAINNTMGGSGNINGAAGGSRSLGMALWLSYPSFFLFPLSASCPSLGNPCLPQMPTAMMLCPTTRGHRAKRSMAGASETVNPNKSFTLLSCLCDTSCHSDGKVQIFFITAGDLWSFWCPHFYNPWQPGHSALAQPSSLFKWN